MPEEGENLVERVAMLERRMIQFEEDSKRAAAEHKNALTEVIEKVDSFGGEISKFAQHMASQTAQLTDARQSLGYVALESRATHEAVIAMQATQEATQRFEERDRKTQKEMEEEHRAERERMQNKRQFRMNLFVGTLTAIIVAILGAFLQAYFGHTIH